ncbi:rhomboid family intramembrane serine protease [Candidatus Azobacteroides pseudotrichonymphae]|uniref:Peptidase S54 rhomboid domain-containing protein n=1 Tax=Azobacteroides pseudotrichonymphae genomovar. CFP2 TaxID=511995 RepID=B6YR20_AZOPC|nr:rhomboid family intramembrane serine protease [Candidatus Azobacteroides pseudotrichonymphae]BAG83642.1 conserved hypothetical protein [Candidatus Azobacteroides pseudotrichonymphae genomovar. CFP2]
MSNDGFALPQVTRNLLIINVSVWIACHYFGGLADVLGLHHFQSKRFSLYQLITYMFTHETFQHLFFNMFALFMFGGAVEMVWKQKRFLTYYIVTGIGAGLVQVLVFYIKISPQEAVMIGASGAIFGLLLAFGILFPETLLYIMFIPIPVKAKYFVVGYGLLEFFYGMSRNVSDNVAHFAHLGGMLFGISMILYWKWKN